MPPWLVALNYPLLGITLLALLALVAGLGGLLYAGINTILVPATGARRVGYWQSCLGAFILLVIAAIFRFV